jgi:hypothetical protein
VRVRVRVPFAGYSCVAHTVSCFICRISIDFLTVTDFKHHLEERYGIATLDQEWLAKDQDQPLQDDDSVCDSIRVGSEVQLLVELKVNPEVPELLPVLLCM